jgi:hypothetical protein
MAEVPGPKITKFTAGVTGDLMMRLRADLERLAVKYGVSEIAVGSATYRDGEITCRMTIKRSLGDGETEVPVGQVDWNNYHKKHDLPADGYGKEVKLNDGFIYKISGLKKMKQKYPVVVARHSPGVGEINKVVSANYIRSVLKPPTLVSPTLAPVPKAPIPKAPVPKATPKAPIPKAAPKAPVPKTPAPKTPVSLQSKEVELIDDLDTEL